MDPNRPKAPKPPLGAVAQPKAPAQRAAAAVAPPKPPLGQSATVRQNTPLAQPAIGRPNAPLQKPAAPPPLAAVPNTSATHLKPPTAIATNRNPPGVGAASPPGPTPATTAATRPKEPRALELAVRINTLRNTVEFLSNVMFDPNNATQARAMVERCQRMFDERPPVEDPKYGEAIDGINAAVAKNEEELSRIEMTVPMRDFRLKFIHAEVAHAQLVYYARFLSGRGLWRDVRRDRFEYVATRLLAGGQTKPPFTLLQRDDVAKLLHAIIPKPPEVDVKTKQLALGFFRDAQQQLTTFTNVQEIFEGGFYLDVRGYKLSLREQLLHPDILYAAAQFNVAFTNYLTRLTPQDAAALAELESTIADQDDEASRVFQSLEDQEQQIDQLFETDREKANERDLVDPKGKKIQRPKWNKARATSRGTWITRGMLAVGLLIGAATIYSYFSRERNHLNDLSAAELAAISPHLSKGAMSKGQDAPAFFGEVSISWGLLDPVARKAAAEQIARGLLDRKIRNAFILLDTRMVVQLRAGKLVMIE